MLALAFNAEQNVFLGIERGMGSDREEKTEQQLGLWEWQGAGRCNAHQGSFLLISFYFFLVVNLGVCVLTRSLLQGKGLEVEKLECCGKTWLSQHALGTPDCTSPSPGLAPTEPTGHKPPAQSVLLPLQRL